MPGSSSPTPFEPQIVDSGATETLWTHEETAAYLRLSPQSLYYLNHKGTGPRSFKVGRWRRYDPADVKAWLQTLAS